MYKKVYYRQRFNKPYAPTPQLAPAVAGVKPECLNWLNTYSGQDMFITSLKDQFQKKGTLSQKQWQMAEKNYQNSLPKVQLPVLDLTNAPIPIMVNRSAAFREIRDKYKLQYGVFALKVKSITNAGVARNGNHWAELEVVADAESPVSACRVCGKTLTDQASILTGVGSVCAKKYFSSLYAMYKKNPQQFIAPFKAEVAKLGTFKVKIWQNQVKQNYGGFVTAVNNFLNQTTNTVPAPIAPPAFSVAPVAPVTTIHQLNWNPKLEPWKNSAHTSSSIHVWECSEFMKVQSWIETDHTVEIEITNELTGNKVIFQSPMIDDSGKVISVIGYWNSKSVWLHITPKK